jgi:hypothetical protein
MMQTIDVDDLDHPHCSVNHRRTAPSGRVDALPRNLIVIPRAGFMTAKVQRSRSPISSCTTSSRASKLLASQNHNKLSKEREEEETGEKYFLMTYSGDPLSLLSV